MAKNIEIPDILFIDKKEGNLFECIIIFYMRTF